MRTINTTFTTFGASVLLLGYKGDSNATEILIDCASALEEYDGTMAAMSITGPDETVYPGDITMDENGIVHWVVAARDCGKAGHGSARIDLVDDNDTVVASAEATTIIMKTKMQGIAPDQIADWTEAASVALQELRDALLDLHDFDDDARVNEAARQLAEEGRVSREQQRVTAETARATAETGRATAETARATAETGRATAESGRVTAESGRVTAETARVSEFNTIRANAQAAMSYIGPSEASSTASAAHPSGSYFTYNGVLYKATADIASGDTITPGTNCAQVPGGAMGEVSNLNSNLSDAEALLADGGVNLIWRAKYYDGYYNGSDEYTGTKTEGKTWAWGVVLIPVPVGAKIIVSGMTGGGVNSAWLNSSDLEDVKRTFSAAYNEGEKTCESGYLALSVYNGEANYKNFKVIYKSEDALREEIQEVDAKYEERFEVIDQESAVTDNFYSNRSTDYSQGEYEGSLASYAVHTTQTYEAENKDIYIYSVADASISTWKIILFVFDTGGNRLGYLDYPLNDSRNVNVKSRYPAADHFCISISSTSGSVPVVPNDAVTKVRAYVGYTKVNSIESYYPRYIEKWANNLYNTDGYVFDGEIGIFTNSGNLFSNNPDDWNVPGWGAGLNYKPTAINTECEYVAIVDPESIPEHLSRAALTIQCLDSGNSALSTTYVYLVNSSRAIYNIGVPEGTVCFNVYFNTGDTNNAVTADDIRKIRLYFGLNIRSTLLRTPEIPYPVGLPSKYIPVQARTVMDFGELPDYWLNYLYEKKGTLDDLCDTIGEHGINFAFITDEHWPNNYQHSPLILKWLGKHTDVDRVISGGDLINEHSTIENAMLFVRDWRDKTNGLHVRNVRGNHDDNSMQSDTTQYLGNGRFYANLIRPIEEENSVTVRDGNLYFYEKIEAQKVCIFYLDTGDIVTSSLIDFDAQIAWMRGIVSEFDSGWSILVIQHIVYDGGTQENPTLFTTGQKTIDFLNSVTNCRVIGLIAGHTHYDYSDTSNGWPIIVTNTDSIQRAQTLPATAGTVSEQLFDVFHIDTSNRKIYATRIGPGEDREWSY